MNIFLIRHGQKISQPGDPGLTELGFVQAMETGKYLKQFNITKIVSSPFRRTVETADSISKVLGLEYELNKDLVERMNWDENAGTKQDFFAEWIKTTNDRDYQPKFGDSSRNTGARVHNCIETIMADHNSVVLVSHGGAIIDYLRNTFSEDLLEELLARYPDGQDYQMNNCAINHISFFNKPKIKLLNYTHHLSNTSE